MNKIDEDEEVEIYNEDTIINENSTSHHGHQVLQYKESDYCRPAVDPSIYDVNQPFIFMQIDMDHCIQSEKGVLRMYAVNRAGNSILVHVHEFLNYFYAECPNGYEASQSNINWLMNELNKRGQSTRNINSKTCVQKIELVSTQSIRLFKGSGDTCKNFLKIYVTQPQFVASLRNLFEKGIMQDDLMFPQLVFEAHIPFPLRFMVDIGLTGMSWAKLKPGQFKFRDEKQFHSRCQMELDVNYTEIVPMPPTEGEWSVIAPMRVLSFDIECLAFKCFPTAQKNQVIQIASVCKNHSDDTNIVQTVFTLKNCSDIVGCEVRSFDDERDLLLAWERFVQVTDPDIITGYNIINFDIPYILERAIALKIPNYGFLGRILNKSSKIKTSTYQSKAMGNRETKEINLEGRAQLDMLIHMHQEHKLSSFTLNSVSSHFLNEQKEDVHYSKIFDLQENGTPDTRRRIATYCLKDALLPLRLMEKLMALYNYTEMARVTGVPVNYLFTRGQQIKVASQLLRKAKTVNLVMPTERSKGSQEKYEGAIVIEPKTKFYQTPIATLDFASLYPSIMMAHNLCYSTLLPTGAERHMNPDDYTRVPSTNNCFVKPSIKKGILCLILEELLAARKQARIELAKATDPFVKAVLDGRQLALKISANSVYGFTGALLGQLPCLEISASVTAFGRQMITQTQKLVEESFNKANGYESDAVVIYGDTDSVMVNFGVSSIEESMKLGKKAAELITATFIKPIRLEFEKVYFPYLLFARKRYAGLLWTNPLKHDKMDKKGIESVRRDNCQLIRTVQSTVLDMVLVDRNTDLAIKYVKNIVKQLLQNKIDLSMLIISKGLTKKSEEQEQLEQQQNQNQNYYQQQQQFQQSKKGSKDPSKNVYKTKQAHVELAEKMRKRDPGTAPNIGDRVQYIAIPGTKGSRNYENVEDPAYVLENDLPIDFEYYIDKQLKKPLKRIFDLIIPNSEILFSRENIHNTFVPKVNTKSAGMMASFVKIRQSCMNCKVALQDQKAALCPACKHKTTEIYLKKLSDLNAIQRSFASLWTQCQNCQENLHQDVLCENRDCSIFYKRTKVKKDIITAQTTINRFENDW